MQPTKTSQIVRVTVLSAAMFLMLSGTGVPGGRGIIAAQRSPAMNSGRPIDPPPAPLGQTPPPGVLDRGGATSPEEQERDRQMADARRKRVAADVDRMAALSNELKADLDEAGKDELSLDVIKKAQEIEKLARDLQKRMKD